MRWRPTSLIVILLACGPVVGGQLWHTPPDRWEEPRAFHSPFRPAYAERLVVGRDLAAVTGSEHHKSPNKAYFYMIEGSSTENPGPWNAIVSIHNERKGLLQVVIKDHSQYPVDVRWVNEKLLFIRVWWGRVLGTDLILDVEKESEVFREMVHDGVIPFQQWKQGKQPNKRVETDP